MAFLDIKVVVDDDGKDNRVGEDNDRLVGGRDIVRDGVKKFIVDEEEIVS